MKSLLGLGKKIFTNPLLFLIVFVLSLGGGAYTYTQYQTVSKELAKIKSSPRSVATEETKKTVEMVAKIVELPKENPTIATVTDAQKLKNQAFFASAQNGDKVLIYTEAKKAYLYRPSNNKIIEVAPVNIGKNQQEVAGASTSVTPTKTPVKIALYNGTKTVGLTNTIEEQIKKDVKNISVVAKANAKKDDYTKTIVIDFNGAQNAVSEVIAKALNGTVEALPEGEERPGGADILVILGQ